MKAWGKLWVKTGMVLLGFTREMKLIAWMNKYLKELIHTTVGLVNLKSTEQVDRLERQERRQSGVKISYSRDRNLLSPSTD